MPIRPSASQTELDAAVADFYEKWKSNYLYTIRGSKYVKYSEYGVETVSEAHGYGMIFAVYMNEQETFDALYSYYKSHPSTRGNYLMAWKQKMTAGQMVDVEGRDSATDGDLDIAFSLLLADHAWGSTKSINYKEAAINCLNDIAAYEVNKQLNNLTVGDWASSDSRQYTRPSDFALAQLYVFARFVPAFETVYNKTVSIVNTYIANHSVALLPDFMIGTSSGAFSAVSGKWLEGNNDGNFYYNACRTPWRLAQDYIMHNNTAVYDSLVKMNKWIKSATNNMPQNIATGYNLTTGKELESYSDNCFIYPFAVSAAISDENQRWLDAIWQIMVTTDSENYYNDSIRLFSMMAVSGKCWSPITQTPQPQPQPQPQPLPPTKCLIWYGLSKETGTNNQTQTTFPCNLCPSADKKNAYEAVGFIWPESRTVAHVSFTHGGCTNNSGFFMDALQLQYYDGKRWKKDVVACDPVYKYEASVCEQTYTFNAFISGIRGIRILGKVNTHNYYNFFSRKAISKFATIKNLLLM